MTEPKCETCAAYGESSVNGGVCLLHKRHANAWECCGDWKEEIMGTQNDAEASHDDA